MEDVRGGEQILKTSTAVPPETNAAPAVAEFPVTWAPAVSPARRKRRVLAAARMAGCALIGVLSVAGAYLMRHGWPPSMGIIRESPYSVWPVVTGVVRMFRAPEFAQFLPLALLAPVVVLWVFRWFGLFRHSAAQVVPFGSAGRIVKASLLSTAGLYLTGAASGSVQAGAEPLYGLLFYGYLGLLLLLGSLLYLAGISIAELALRACGVGMTRVAVIARGSTPGGLCELLAAPASEYRFVGVISPEPEEDSAAAAPAEGGVQLAGTLDQLDQIINKHYLDEIILAMDPGGLTTGQRIAVAQTCWQLGVDLKMVTPFHPYFHTRGAPELIGHIPLMLVERTGLYKSWPQAAKRAVDIVVSASALVALAPLMLLTALLIKLESAGPVLFVQERPGLHGRVFRILKFRSMYADADHRLHQEAQRRLIREGAAATLDKDGKPIYGKVGDDPRITRVGKWLRRTSIDELPQLINVLKGEMSLVGPRPSVLYELDEYTDRHRLRLHIRPGITGLWQVSGRSRLTFDQMVDLDIHYIEKWSLWLDVKILVKTIPVVFNIRQAY